MKKGSKTVKFDQLSDDEVVEVKTMADLPTLSNKLLALPIHLPILLYGMFQYGLTANVKEVLAKGYVSLVCIQLAYNYIIYTQTVSPGLDKSKKSKKKKESGDNLLLLLISSITLPMVLSIPIFILIILFGAPLGSHLTETFLLSNHLSIIAISPILILFKLDFNKFTEFFKIDNFFNVLFHNSTLFSSFLSIISTWLGVIPIPLDWDRPWQNWPITLLVGGYLGFFTGSLINLCI